MKKLLILASLGSLTLFYSCGGDAGAPGEKAASAGTAAAMANATMGPIINYLIPDSLSINTVEDITNTVCLLSDPASSATVTTTATDANSGTKVYAFTTCSMHFCDGDFAWLTGTLTNNYSNSATTFSMTLKGTITFEAAPAGWDQSIIDRTHFAGKTCEFDLTVTDAPTTITSQTELDPYISGYACGYAWSEVSIITEEDYCLAI